MSDLISLVKIKDQYYLQCSDLEKWPAPLLFNFCVASRVPIEFYDQMNHWSSLVQEGYPEVLAFLLSHSCNGKGFKYARGFPEHGHHWFDPSSDWLRIIEGKPDLGGYRYSKHPAEVTPSNVIWGVSEDYKVIAKMTNVEAAEFFGFKFPPKREKQAPKKLSDHGIPKWQGVQYQFHEQAAVQQALNALQGAQAADQAAINHLNQFVQPQAALNNLIQGQVADNAWAQVNEVIAQQAAPPQPFFEHDEDDFPEHDDFPDFYDEDEDD